MRHHIPRLASLSMVVLLSSCASIDRMGTVGKNDVYSISSSNFLSASQMILVVNNDDGKVSAYSGGTTSGYGSVGLQAGGALLSAGAIAYAGHSVERGLENTSVRGIPNQFKLKAGLDDDTKINIHK